MVLKLIEPQFFIFDDITIGLKKIFNVKITESMIDNFASLSGDYNPLHMDSNYAKTTSFEKRVVHGMLLSSFFSQIVGMHIPGKNALYLSQTLRFVSPCYINDEIFVEGEVIDKSPATKIVTLKTIIKRNDEKVLVEGLAKICVR
jgi:3-hydroxybutyryl-CoA dehydratase